MVIARSGRSGEYVSLKEIPPISPPPNSKMSLPAVLEPDCLVANGDVGGVDGSDTSRKCSSCGKCKDFEEFSGRATCNACRTRKRLKSTALVSERREALNIVQLENQWLKDQLTASANKLKAAEQESVRLSEMLRTHAADAFREHVATNSSDSSYQQSPPRSSNTYEPSFHTALPGAPYTMQTQIPPSSSSLPAIHHSQLPSSASKSGLLLGPASPPATNFDSLKRKQPEDWHAAEVNEIFSSQLFTDEINELRELSAFFYQEYPVKSAQASMYPLRPNGSPAA